MSYDATAVFQTVWTASLLPRNKTAWEGVIEGVDDDLISRDPVGLVPAARDPNATPIELLPYLAAERSVDEYSTAWPEAQRRAAVAGSFAYHRVKGTRPALVAALTPLGYSLTVVEWFEATPLQRPYTFNIIVTLDNIAPWGLEDAKLITRVANRAKNAHTLLEFIDVRRPPAVATTYVGGFIKAKTHILVEPPILLNVTPPPARIYIGGMHKTRQHVRIFPRG